LAAEFSTTGQFSKPFVLEGRLTDRGEINSMKIDTTETALRWPEKTDWRDEFPKWFRTGG